MPRCSSCSEDVSEVARFVPGTVLGRRCRTVGLLGLGGMDEVYRADDFRLGRPLFKES